MRELKLPEGFMYIAAFLTMRCNLNCSFCLNNVEKSKGFNRSRYLESSGDDWVRALNRVTPLPNVPVTLSGGEPFVHKDFISIINGLKPELNIDILTNLQWGRAGIERFAREVKPERLKRASSYASIRVSYHHEQMGDGAELVNSVKILKDKGFSIGIWAVQHPAPKTLEAITQMQFRCREAGIDFRLKDFTGKYSGEDDFGDYFSIVYGDYSRYPHSAFGLETTKNCECKTSELLIGPDLRVYRCHRDLYAEEFSIGSLMNDNFAVEDKFRACSKYGQCHPCDVKVKTNYRQQLGHTSVEMRKITD